MKFRFEWRPGWAASKLERANPRIRQKRAERIARDAKKALTRAGWRGDTDNKNAVTVEIMVDLTKRGNRNVNTGELLGFIGPLVEAMPYKVECVSLQPVQFARPGWHGSASQLKAHTAKTRKIANRYRRRGNHKIADGLMRSLFYGPSVDVSVVIGKRDITGGVDTGEKSTYQTGKKVKDFEALRKNSWASVKVEGPESIEDLAWDARFFVNRMGIAKKLDWGSVIHIVITKSRKSQITMRDWGASG